MALPGFTAGRSLYSSKNVCQNIVRSVLWGVGQEEISLQAIYCQTGCGDCKYHTAYDYEDPFTDPGPQSDGCWKRCCNSSHSGFVWRTCSPCTLPTICDPRCGCGRFGATGGWMCIQRCHTGTYSFDVPCRLSSGCKGGCPPPGS
jgi:hypothetical protein